MALSFVVDPDVTTRLREAVVTLWTAVTNAGGAVGFIAPVTPAEVAVTAEAELAAVTAGPDRLLVGYQGAELVALALFVDNRFELMDHWCSLKRVMVHPDAQGYGHGLALMRAAERVARAAGQEALRITLRSGHGLERFYARCGYVEVGRLPGALRVGPGDDRDDVHMWLSLHPDTITGDGQ